MGFGCDPIAFSSELVPSSWKDDDYMDFLGEKRSKEEAFGKEETKRRKKRRMSSLGFLSPMFFEDNLKMSRRDSITFGPDENDPLDKGDEKVEEEAVDSSVEDKEPLKVESASEKEKIQEKVGDKKEDDKESNQDDENEEDDEDDDEEDDDDDDDSSTGSIVVEPIEFQPQIEIDSAKIRETMEAFHKAMEMSQNSQQAIHDWDRKMGLKRSHSKTMRLSSRSRKKLKAIMKKEINTMVSVKCWESLCEPSSFCTF